MCDVDADISARLSHCALHIKGTHITHVAHSFIQALLRLNHLANICRAMIVGLSAGRIGDYRRVNKPTHSSSILEPASIYVGIWLNICFCFTANKILITSIPYEKSRYILCCFFLCADCRFVFREKEKKRTLKQQYLVVAPRSALLQADASKRDENKLKTNKMAFGCRTPP